MIVWANVVIAEYLRSCLRIFEAEIFLSKEMSNFDDLLSSFKSKCFINLRKPPDLFSFYSSYKYFASKRYPILLGKTY